MRVELDVKELKNRAPKIENTKREYEGDVRIIAERWHPDMHPCVKYEIAITGEVGALPDRENCDTIHGHERALSIRLSDREIQEIVDLAIAKGIAKLPIVDDLIEANQRLSRAVQYFVHDAE